MLDNFTNMAWKRRVAVSKLCVIALAGIVLSVLALPAWAVSLGAGANYILLFEGASGKTLSVNNFGTTGIWTGNIGIAGTGKLQATGPGTLNGNIDFAASNKNQASISNTTVLGSVNYGVTQVQTAMDYLNALSTSLGAEHTFAPNVAINTTVAQTIQTSNGFLDSGGNRVFNVTSFQSNNGENLILKSDGANDVVFDIKFSVQFNGNILLQDLTGKFFGDTGYAGLYPDQVLWNVYGNNHKMDLNNNGNSSHPSNITYGVFLDPYGTVSAVNTRLVGRIFGGNTQNMQVVSGNTITAPPQSPSGHTPEPVTLAGFCAGLAGVAGYLRKRVAR
jgi:hypothetical protein